MDNQKNFLEVEGDSVEDAIKKGMDLLKTSAENVDIEIVNEPANGFLKFGRKKAKVRLTLLRGTIPAHLLKKEEAPAEQPFRRHERISVEEILVQKEREREHHEAAKQHEKEEKTNSFRQYREQKQNQGQRENQQRRGQQAGQQRQEQRQDNRPPQQHHRNPQQNAPQHPVQEPQEPEVPYEATEEDKTNLEKLNGIFMKLTNLMGFNVEPEISALSNKYRIIIKDTPDASLLIGKNGKTIEALQHIVNKISLKEGVNKPVYLDIKGYVKQKRKNKFEKRWKRERQ